MLRIAQGRVYDPANGIDGEVRDVCLDGGKVVEEVPSDAPRLDARGMVVMPGGVDIHSHIAGPAVNAARKLAPEEHRADVVDRTAVMRSGTGGTVPSTFATGYRYALLGYTTVVDAATPPLAARHALAELRDTPIVDAAFLVLMGNNLPLFELIREAAPEARACRGGRVVARGDRWLRRQAGQPRRRRDVEARQPQRDLARRRGWGWASRRAACCPRSPARWTSSASRTRSTSTATTSAWRGTGVRRWTRSTPWRVGGRTSPTCSSTPTAGARASGPARALRSWPSISTPIPEHSADVGQVMFGPATTMTADAPVSALLRDITGGKWVNADVEAETGCGIVPFAYQERNYVHALQWGIGLELFLLSRDPWRVVLSTDHPNGGSFLSYPRLIRLLMDREFRNEEIARANKKAIGRTVLLDNLAREYTLGEIAIITRAGPARLLGPGRQGPSRRRRGRRRDGLQRATPTARRCSRGRAT